MERAGKWSSAARAVIAAILALTGACSFGPPAGTAPAGPVKVWSGEKPPIPVPQSERTRIDEEIAKLVENPRPVSLAELIDYALKTNPLTRSSWLRTQSAWGSLGMERSDYYPDVSIGGQIQRSRQTPSFSGLNVGSVERTDRGPYLNLNWLLFDFGAREARIEEKRAALIAANYAHNAALQQVVLEVQRSFYQYIAFRSLEKSQLTNMQDAQLNLDAAESRRIAGVATVADVLQAKTALSRVRFSLQATRGRIQAVRGAVLTAAGLSPASKIDIGELDLEDLPAGEIGAELEALIEKVQEENPNLLAARARAAEAASRVDSVNRSGYPSLSAYGQGSRYFRDDKIADDYTTGLRLTYPLFTGFSYSYELMRSRADAEKAVSDYKLEENARTLALWTDYYNYKTAGEQILSSQDLLASATQSYEVALGRYREGVGSILDLLSSQTALEIARAAHVEARANWLLSLAQLRYDIGSLSSEPGTVFEVKKSR